MNRENGMMCIVFAMGMEAHPFLRRVEVTQRWRSGSATYRTVFFEGHVLLTVKSGVGPTKAKAAVQRLNVLPSAILSVGTAGALADGLRVGDVVVASETLSEKEDVARLGCSTILQEALGRACAKEGLAYTSGSLITMPKSVFRTDDRMRLHAATGAMAVDMESHALSRQALKLGIPFACLRVISDDIRAGSFPSLPNLRQLWRYPLKAPEIFRSALQFRQFLKNFRAAIHVLPPVLVRFIRDSGRLLG
jgi:adenosylhomocysteine nucleosidase